MSRVSYTAKRSIIPGHAIGERYVFDMPMMESVPAAEDIRIDERSAGGAFESVLHRTEVTWTFRTEPIRGEARELMREFLESTESGQTFRIWLYGSESQPIYFKRADDGHTEDSYLELGHRDLDYVTMSFRAIEAVSEYVTDITETVDVYVEIDTGALDPPPATADIYLLDDDPPVVSSTSLNGLVSYTIPNDGNTHRYIVVVGMMVNDDTATFGSLTLTYGGIPLSVVQTVSQSDQYCVFIGLASLSTPPANTTLAFTDSSSYLGSHEKLFQVFTFGNVNASQSEDYGSVGALSDTNIGSGVDIGTFNPSEGDLIFSVRAFVSLSPLDNAFVQSPTYTMHPQDMADAELISTGWPYAVLRNAYSVRNSTDPQELTWAGPGSDEKLGIAIMLAPS